MLLRDRVSSSPSLILRPRHSSPNSLPPIHAVHPTLDPPLSSPAQDKGIAHPSVHSATLGKGKSDDTLLKVKNGDLKGKGEVTLVFGKQDTHDDRAGRTLIRDTFDDAGLTMTVSPVAPWRRGAVSLGAQAARCTCFLGLSCVASLELRDQVLPLTAVHRGAGAARVHP